MARANHNRLPPASNISTGEDRVDPATEAVEEIEVEAATVQDETQAIFQEAEAAAEAVISAPATTPTKPTATMPPKAVKLEAFEARTLLAITEAVNSLGENQPWDAVVPYASIPKEYRPLLRNLSSRGLIDLTTDEDEGDRIVALKLAQKGFISLTDLQLKDNVTGSRKTSAAPPVATTPPEPKVNGRRFRKSSRTFSNPDYKLVVVAESNPRRVNSQGFHAWNLLQSGMSLEEYLSQPWDRSIVCENGKKFEGPTYQHIESDLSRGYLQIIDISQPEFADPEGKYPNLFRYVARVKMTDPEEGAKAPLPKDGPKMTAAEMMELTRAKLAAQGQEGQATA